MKRISHLIVAIVALPVCIACDTEDQKTVDDMVTVITPKSDSVAVAGSGEHVLYTIDFHTQHDYVQRLKISSFDAVNGNTDLLDTTFTDKITKYYFDYSTPILNRDSIDIKLTFEAWDNAGSKNPATTRTVRVLNRQHLLEEKTGIVLRATDSGMPNAFAFSAPSQTFNCQLSPDSANADIYLIADADYSNLAFESKTKAKMVRINSFDYPAATALSLNAMYEGTLRQDRIDHLLVNDIILVGHDTRAEGIIMITNVVRTGMPQEHCLQLSFKGVE